MLETVVSAAEAASNGYDVILIGSGFGSSFFLARALRDPRPRRYLVIEAGRLNTHEWQIANQRNSPIDHRDTYRTQSDKTWQFTMGFGGGTNCWFAQTPRFIPSDFRLKSTYGAGLDWPIDYDDLEPYYHQAETLMSISGPDDMTAIIPRSAPFPQPAHRFSSVDRLVKAAQPDRHFVMPTARARVPTDTRNACCAALRCGLCPANAKFNAENGLMDVYNDPRVSVCLEAPVTALESASDVVTGVRFTSGGKDYRVRGDLVVLGANAIHSPAILLRSGMSGGPVGEGLHESYGVNFEALLDGVDNFDGSTITTGLNYALYIGDFRREVGGAMLQFENKWTHGLRMEKGRWRQTLPIIAITEDLLETGNRVTVDPARPDIPVVDYKGPSDYALKGMQRVRDKLPEVLSALPVEKIIDHGPRPTESHLQGTLRMGDDAATSVVDRDQIHHRWRNLVVAGSAVFASCSGANPSLTVAALSMRAADRLYGRRSA